MILFGTFYELKYITEMLQQDMNVKCSSKDFLQEMIMCYDIMSSEDLGNEKVRRTNKMSLQTTNAFALVICM